MPPLHLRSEILRSLLYFRKHEHLPDPPLFPDLRDRRFYTNFLKGVFRQQGLLDQAIKRHTHGGLSSLSPQILEILRLGAYDLLFMRTPNHAAVNETVALCRGPQSKARGLINAVLRRVAKEHAPNLDDLKLEDIIPASLAESWQKLISQEQVRSMIQSLQTQAPLSLRVNLEQTSPQELLEELKKLSEQVSFSPILPNALLAVSLPPLDTLEVFLRGHFYVQNQASQIPTWLLDPQPGERILDACAAPGGKTTHLAERTNYQANILALDPNEDGLRRLRENLNRLGTENVSVLQGDFLANFEGDDQPFDRILLDAPCSGWGILREHPQWRWTKDAQAPARHAVIQKKMLQRALSLLKPGGTLVYSVCTFSPEETWNVIDGIPREDPKEFLPETLHGFVQENAVDIKPGPHDLDGFFMARFRSGLA